MNYRDAEHFGWSNVREAGVPMGRLPLPVHIPLNKPFQSDLIICDAAMNAWLMPVPPNMTTHSVECAQIRNTMKVTLVSVAFGEAPFVPEFRQIVWSREPGGYPIVTGKLDVNNMMYGLTYCVEPTSGELYIHGFATNTGEVPLPAVLRFRRAQPVEREVTDYHYVSFRWDAARWEVGEQLEPPEVIETDFDAETEAEWNKTDDDYNKYFGCSCPYFAHPGMRLYHGGGVLKLSAEIPPKETRVFTIRAGFFSSVCQKNFTDIVDGAKRYWDGFLTTQADFGDNAENDIFRQFQWGNLQFLLNTWKDAAESMLQPCQGGTSERFYVWVWEAMEMLRPMLKLGHFKPIQKVLEFILSLQDGGSMPEGDFTTLDGAIGTTGPRWANSTGSALLLASEYMELSGDEDFKKRHLANLVRAAKWILGQVKATRHLNPDGSKCLGYGLMPSATATDGDRGYIYVMTDSWSCVGVERLLRVLKAEGHPDFEEMERECRQYRQDISAAIDTVRRPDGFIDRKLSVKGQIATVFSATCSSLKLLDAEYADNMDERMEGMVEFSEKTVFDGLFCAPMRNGMKYLGNIERVMTRFYMAHGEWKKAYLAWRTFRNYGMTTPLSLTQERFSKVDDTFTPWQPNSSGNGRYLDVMLERFCYRTSYGFVLLGGFAPFHKRELSIQGIHTLDGDFSMTVRGGRLTAVWGKKLPVGTRFRIPAYFNFRPDGMLKADADGLFTLTEFTDMISGAIDATPSNCD
ncbi:MAG: hypothetical protein J6X55_16360 [Victivallales bacterium]|nr:hypothetical protein [Victivallales bacterium]